MSRKIKVFGAGVFIFAASSINAGFYGGAGIGSDTVDFAQRALVSPISDGIHTVDFDVINKSHLSGTGVFGTLFVGFGKLYNKFYLAGEASVNISSVTHTAFNHEFIHGNFADTFIKMQNSFGLSVLPGFQFTPSTLFYGRLGWTNSKIQQRTGDLSLANFIVRRDGFRYGVGVKQAITDRVAVRMDYSRIAYDSVLTNTNDGVVPKKTQISPNQQLVEFGVAINFA
jgi:outer membrane immunogenic protein